MRYPEIKQEFARAGFTSCPLTDEEITRCIEAKADVYGVGCDTFAGWSFEKALEANSTQKEH